jgi:hypothetical protein
MDKDLAKTILGLHEDYALEFVQEGDWVQEHKNQYKSDIVIYEDDYYQIDQSRSGSYHSDWFYDNPIVFPVERKVEIVEKVTWVKH